MDFRIGTGYDVHRLAEGRRLILGGVEIPHILGLLGHSDADVLLHAIMDSMTGAAKKGDIGRLFPDTDDEFEGISSIELLRRVNELIKKDGWKIENIDSIIIAQKPKLMNYIAQMERNISQCLGIDESRVNVKATTEEGLGFSGREEGIAAQAVCLISKKLRRE